MTSWAKERITIDDPTMPWTTVPAAVRELDKITGGAVDDETALLKDVLAFLHTAVDRLP